MGLFDMFRRPKSELEKAQTELNERLFPGGQEEIHFKAKTVVGLSNGKLNVEEAGRVCVSVKSLLFFKITAFDGRENLGPNAERLMEFTIETAQFKLAKTEAAAIVFYLYFNEVDSSLETPKMLKMFFDGVYGSDSYGCDTDAIPSGLGEFGYEPTNPVPVRGMASNEIYLSGLRTADGRAVKYKKAGSITVPNISGDIDEFEISQDGQAMCKLYVCPYNKKISGRPPRGFILIQAD